MALAQSSSDTCYLASTLSCYGFVRYLQGDIDAAITMLRQGVSLQEANGGQKELTILLDNLGYAYAGAGDFAAARAQFARATRIALETHKVGLILDIALGWTATLTGPGEASQAVGWMTFIAEHPATWLETRNRAAKWLAEQAAGVPAAEFAAAQAQGRGLRYEDMVKIIVGED